MGFIKRDWFLLVAAGSFVVLALFNIGIGAYHTVLFASQGSMSLFTVAYGIPVTAADMRDPARLLGSDAIEVYSILLGGYGVISLWATWLSLRGNSSGFWINTIMVGIAQIAIFFALIVPGRLTGANAYADIVLYGIGVAFGGVSLVRGGRIARVSSVARSARA